MTSEDFELFKGARDWLSQEVLTEHQILWNLNHFDDPLHR
jgi:hypothetical protein